ncbi:MAG: C40 family peptidase [Chlamydia sp.]
MPSPEWIKIRKKIDRYIGWVRKENIYERNDPFPSAPTLSIARLAAHVYDREDTRYGAILTLPFGSVLEYLDEEAPNKRDERWIAVRLVDRTRGYIQRGDVTFNSTPISLDEMILLGQKFLHLPYTWGGRSSFGYDRSGFVQMLYRQMGIFIPRNSKTQMGCDIFQSVDIQKLRPGDLLFFGLSENDIRHVGMYIGDNQFIHSSPSELKPFIHISSLSDSEWDGKPERHFAYRAARSLKNHFLTKKPL